MAQKAQIIDVTRSYVPGDPNAYPENLVSTDKEDGEEKTPPISPYEGYNFMPTAYGYKSYFGTNAHLNIPPVPARAQFLLSYQSGEYVNNLIALCEDGIWIIDPTSATNTWKHVIVHTFDADVFEEWTWCVIENAVYCYKQGGASYYHTSDVNDVPNGLGISIVTVVPTFLNMAGQMGIFKAGTRLGFWDSMNSVSWSNNVDLHDFTPSMENLAGNTIFGFVVGRITHIRDHGEGFVVYSTKSIVGVSFSAESNMLWDPHLVSNTCGVSLGRSVTQGSSSSEHLVYTTSGFYRVGSYNGLTKIHEFTPVAVELGDLLKENRDPVYMDCHEGRYLFLHAIDPAYINGIVSFTTVNIAAMDITQMPPIPSSKIANSLLVKMIQEIELRTADPVYGATLTPYTVDGTPFDLIEWEMSFKILSSLGLWERDKHPEFGGLFAYSTDEDLDRSNLAASGYAWDNRTPTGQTFIPASDIGYYAPLSDTYSAPFILTEEEFLRRTSLVDMDPAAFLSKYLQVQFDALNATTEAEVLETASARIFKQSCGTAASYLPVAGRSSNGLLSFLFGFTSIWREFEKRQQLLIESFQEVLAKSYTNKFSMYGATGLGTFASTVITAEIIKPEGAVGIMPMDKGFVFYKQYREILDLTIAYARSYQLRTYPIAGDAGYSVGNSWELWDRADLTVTDAFPASGVQTPTAGSITQWTDIDAGGDGALWNSFAYTPDWIDFYAAYRDTANDIVGNYIAIGSDVRNAGQTSKVYSIYYNPIPPNGYKLRVYARNRTTGAMVYCDMDGGWLVNGRQRLLFSNCVAMGAFPDPDLSLYQPASSQQSTVSLPFTQHSPAYLQDLIATGEVYFPALDKTYVFKPLNQQAYSVPWNTLQSFPVKAWVKGTTYPDMDMVIRPYMQLRVPTVYSSGPAYTSQYVRFLVQKEPSSVGAAYPYLMSAVGDTGIGTVFGYYSSLEQAYITVSQWSEYLRWTMVWVTGPTGIMFRGSGNPAHYRVVEKPGYLELWCDSITTTAGASTSGVVAVLHQDGGSLYKYDITENITGSLLDNGVVKESGAMLDPTLSTAGAGVTLGALLTPKNKIRATMNAGVLSLGATTLLDVYSDVEDYADSLLNDAPVFSDPTYLLPPSYGEGERWWFMKTADLVYQSCTPFSFTAGKIAGIPTAEWSTSLYLADKLILDIPTEAEVAVPEVLGTMPELSLTLQDGTPAPNYPTFRGAYVFDLTLKKWGKLKADYKNILSLYPLNSNLGGTISYTNFGVDSGIVLSDGTISIFDSSPIDSWIRFGKIGYSRLGMTNLLEVKAMFRKVSWGSITTDSSLDGRNLSQMLQQTTSFTNTTGLTVFPDVSARWHTVKISGNYDLQYLEVRGTIAGRR